MAKRTHGTPEQFLNALENKINELGGYDVDSATNISNVPSKPEMKNVKSSEMNIDKERYLHNLIGDLELDLEDLVQGFTADYEDDNLYVTVETFDGNTREYKVPFSDLNWDFKSMDTDVAYISDHIAEDLDLDPTSDLDYDEDEDIEAEGSTWDEFIRNLEENNEVKVDAAYKYKYTGDKIIFYRNNQSFEGEVTKYFNGDYELNKYNVHKIRSIENSTSVNSSKKAKFEYEDRRGYKYTEKELRRILEDQRDLYPGVSYENWIKINIDEGQLFPIKEAISFEENDDEVMSSQDYFIKRNNDYERIEDKVEAEVIKKLESQGVDTDSTEAGFFLDRAIDLIMQQDNPDVDYWWKKLMKEYKEDVDELPHRNNKKNSTNYDDGKYLDQDGEEYTLSELKEIFKNEYHPDMSFDEWLSESLENGYLFKS
jgi:hypothetical protein